MSEHDTGTVRTAGSGSPKRGSRSGGRTRIGGAWVAVALAAIVLLLLLIFILQNLQSVQISYFGATGQLPLGVGLLLAAVGGALLVVVLGAARILQLRAFAWRQRRSGKGP